MDEVESVLKQISFGTFQFRLLTLDYIEASTFFVLLVICVNFTTPVVDLYLFALHLFSFLVFINASRCYDEALGSFIV